MHVFTNSASGSFPKRTRCWGHIRYLHHNKWSFSIFLFIIIAVYFINPIWYLHHSKWSFSIFLFFTIFIIAVYYINPTAMNNVLLSISKTAWIAHAFVFCSLGSDFCTIQLDNKQQTHLFLLLILNTSYSFQEKKIIRLYSFSCQIQLKEIPEYIIQWWLKHNL